ncbi:MAG: hypothetical protein NC078_10315, partial [Ruminococcus sp.]|nr:hypothetical protein [Ruminococcus sp.]
MDKNELDVKIREEISRELEGLESLEQGTEEHSAAVKSVAELYKLELDKQKADTDESVKNADVKSGRLRLLLDFAVSAAGIIIPQIFYSIWMKKGFK